MSEVPSGGPENESGETSSGSDTQKQAPKTAGFERPEDYHKRVDPTRPKTVLNSVSHPEAQRFVPFRPPKFITKDIKNYTQGFVKPSCEIANATKEKFLVGFTNVTSQEKLRYQSAQAKQVVLEIDRAEKSGGFDASSLMSWLNFRIDHKFREVAGEDPNVKGRFARQKAWFELRKLEMWRTLTEALATGRFENEKAAKKFIRQQHRKLLIEIITAFSWEKSISLRKLGLKINMNPGLTLRRGKIISEKAVTQNANARKANQQNEGDGGSQSGSSTQPPYQPPPPFNPPPTPQPPSPPIPTPPAPQPPTSEPSQPETPEQPEYKPGTKVTWIDENGQEHSGTILEPEETAPPSPAPTKEPEESSTENIDTDDPERFIDKLDNLKLSGFADFYTKISGETMQSYIKSLKLSGAKIEALNIEFFEDDLCSVAGNVSAGWKGGAEFFLVLQNDNQGQLGVVSQEIKARGVAKAASGQIGKSLGNIHDLILNNINSKLKNNQVKKIGIAKNRFGVIIGRSSKE